MTENRDIAIRFTGVSKQYRLGTIGGRTLQQGIQSWWASKRGREDPNQQIDAIFGEYGKEFLALDGIDLTIYRGERVGIIGNNGAGKTTLLKLLSRITAPTRGDIDIWGRISSLLEIGAGFHREMTGRENIYMNGAILGMSKSEIDGKLHKIIEFSEIRDFIDTPAKRYSSGMYVKLAFAVAAYLDSEILVMDEVLAVGDMSFQQKCLNRMREAADTEGRTILYVSHNVETIRRLCDRVVVLNQGRIIYDGEPEQGISIYMNHNLDENSPEIDLRGKSINDVGYISMEHISILDKASLNFGEHENLKLLLRLQVRDDADRENGESIQGVKDIRLRLTFRDKGDVGIGTSWSAPFSIPGSGVYDIPFSLSFAQFAKGVFYVSVGIYRQDEIGRRMMLSHVTRAFRIEVQGLPVWNTTAHGYMKLTETEVGKVEHSS